ncbi:MAG: alpha-amylase family protein [Bacteroidales bacterium]|nr:alpha-amylase family protein [Bacteroidales bacterium]
MGKPEKIIIYQLLVRLAGNKVSKRKLWGSIEENGCGKFDDLDLNVLQKIACLGATHLWLTGVIEHASCTAYPQHSIKADNPLVVKGRAGSPYAIRDYYDVCPDLATSVDKRMEEFEALMDRCRKAGLAPVIDFIPNHVARNYASDQPAGMNDALGTGDNTSVTFDPSNNFYYLPGEHLKLPHEVFGLPHTRLMKATSYEEFPAKATGNDCFSSHPSINDWYETVKLNYGIDFSGGHQSFFDPVPDTWHKMLHILEFWAGKKVAGFRCDMAEMVPAAFWKWAIGKIKHHHPEMLFIAEIYDPRLYRQYTDAGFDYLYDKVGLYDALRDVLAGNRPAASLTLEWQKLNGLDERMLRFIENHDEQRIASKHVATAEAGFPAMTVAATLHRGPAMIYFGQEFGEKAEGAAGFSGDDGRTSIFDYDHVPAFQRWYNEGSCNTEKLSSNEKQCYAFYKKLLNLARHEVVSKGEFYDVMWANQDFQQSSLYAYLRWLNGSLWFICVNFSGKQHLQGQLRIPDHYWQLTGQNNPEASWLLKPLLTDNVEKAVLQRDLVNIGVDIHLPPYSGEIIEFRRV